MLLNSYTLPDLVDLALKVPEVGAVNFNILYTVLQTMITELGLTDTRPWCHIENPLNAKAALTQAKLKGTVKRSSLPSSSSTLQRSVGSEARFQVPLETKHSQTNTISEDEESKDIVQYEETPTSKPIQSTHQASQTDVSDKKYAEEQPSHIHRKSQTDILDRNVEEQPSHSHRVSQTDVTDKYAEEQPSHYHRKSQTDVLDRKYAEEQPSHVHSESQTDMTDKNAEEKPTHTHRASQISTEMKQQPDPKESKEETVSSEKTEKQKDPQTDDEKDRPKRPQPKPRPEEAGWEDISHELKAHRESISEAKIRDDQDKGKGQRHVRDGFRTTQLEKRVEAAEEGLMRLSEIVDWVVNKIQKSEARRKQGTSGLTSGGPTSVEIEDLEDRIIELEEGKEVWDYDHSVLVDVEEALKAMQEEFENIKALGNDLEEMKGDILKKADKEEMIEALALKGDSTLVNTKVDQVEFETAFEELGEAIGLLGIKFQKKNDEWEERADKLWVGVDGKMTEDVFEAARREIEDRLTALMYGMKVLKQVVEELVYPDAGGVTRCITCRRPADISGHKCMRSSISPKRPHKSSDDSSLDGFIKVTEALDKNKKQKCNGPPYGESNDTILKIPYNSSTYNSSNDDIDIQNRRKMRLAPVNKNSKTGQKSSATSKPGNYLKTRKEEKELFFTNIMLSRNTEEESKTDSTASEKSRKSSSASTNHSGSSLPDIDIDKDTMHDLLNFPPLRMMPDPSRRGKINPVKKPQQKNELILPPLRDSSESTTESTESDEGTESS